MAAFADCETHAFFHGNRGDQLNVHINVVAGHAHLSAFGQGDDAGNVGGTEVELRTIVVEERGMTAALFLLQDVNVAIEGGVGMNRTGLAQALATLDLVTVNATQQGADVIASLSELQALAEHLEAGDGGGPQFYFRTTDVTGIITLPEGTEMCMPGDNVDMHVELITPVAMEEGLRFAIREGGHTVGSGVVSKIEK